jgi:3-hydroxyacyl-[acyl-carrier-protein] dehydratase
MLFDDFFEIVSITCNFVGESEQKLQSVILLRPNHPIFAGHFPGNPVVPGVCQVQMIKELVEKALNHPLRLYESDNIKFLSMIDPRGTTQLEVEINIKKIAENQYSANALIKFESTVCLKFKGKFEIES